MSGVRATVLHGAAVLVTFAALSVAARSAAAQAPQMTDESLKERIEYGLDTSPIVRKYDVKVKVAAGEVILSGDVATEAQKAEAARLAKVAGAVKIQNAIIVDPDEDKSVTDRIKAGLNKAGDRITDGWITAKVKWFFTGDELLKGSDIDIDTKDNVVTLKGTVKSAEGRARAVALATDTEGVRRVIDTLVIVK